MAYRRTKDDSPLHCPYCGKQFSMNGRYSDYYKAFRERRTPMTECAQCGETFYYHNLSAKYCKEHGIKATWKRGEYDTDRKEADSLWQACCSTTIRTDIP